MPVHRYRRIEDVPEPPAAADALRGLQAACELSEMSRVGRRFVAPRGVRRFRSIEEADAYRQSWEMPPQSG